MPGEHSGGFKHRQRRRTRLHRLARKTEGGDKSFIIKNIGKRVYLKLTFSGDEPHAFRSQFGDPVFSVDRFTYSFECGDNEPEVEWTTRCKGLNWDAASRTISGHFKITEPDPKVMRTNRSFYLTPVK